MCIYIYIYIYVYIGCLCARDWRCPSQSRGFCETGDGNGDDCDEPLIQTHVIAKPAHTHTQTRCAGFPGL